MNDGLVKTSREKELAMRTWKSRGTVCTKDRMAWDISGASNSSNDWRRSMGRP